MSDDIMLAVSNGEDFKRKIVKNKELSSTMLQKITMPPRYPYPGKLEEIKIWKWDPLNETWEENYNKLIDYIDIYDKIPSQVDKIDKKLGQWASDQRKYNKKNNKRIILDFPLYLYFLKDETKHTTSK